VVVFWFGSVPSSFLCLLQKKIEDLLSKFSITPEFDNSLECQGLIYTVKSF
jgi:hypothetical protein